MQPASCSQQASEEKHLKTCPQPVNLPPLLPGCPLQDVRVKGVPDSLRNQLQKRGVGRLALDLVAPKQEGLERVFQMMLG